MDLTAEQKQQLVAAIIGEANKLGTPVVASTLYEDYTHMTIRFYVVTGRNDSYGEVRVANDDVILEAKKFGII